MALFITFEGIEGSGKSTQIRNLSAKLVSCGEQVVATRRTELLLYAAARAQHVAEIIEPALVAGKHVLCDRFFDATTVYQGLGRGLPLETLSAINNFATGSMVPDLTLLLDIPADVGLMRARQRNDRLQLETESRFEAEDLSFHQRIRTGYLELAKSAERFRIIDANGPPEAVAERVWKTVERFMTGQ